MFLPPYSLDCSPIELAFAKLKAPLRKALKRTLEGLWNAVVRVPDAGLQPPGLRQGRRT